VSLPEDRLVDSAAPFTSQFIKYEDATTHSHGPAGEHSHEGLDGHTWVDPVLALAQAEVIHRAMVEKFPRHKKFMDEGFSRLQAKLRQLDKHFKTISTKASEVPILFSHPAYNYIAKRYGWRCKSLDLDPSAKLTPEQVAGIRALLKLFPAKALVWESEPAAELRSQVRDDLGLRSVVFSPCELMDPSELKKGIDYAAVMGRNTEVMKQVFLGAGASE